MRDLAAAQTVTSHAIRTNIFLQKQTLRKMEGLGFLKEARLKSESPNSKKYNIETNSDFLELFSYYFQNLTMKMTEFFNFVKGFGFPILFSIFGWSNGQLWIKIRIYGFFQNFGVKMALSFCAVFGFGFSDFFAIF